MAQKKRLLVNVIEKTIVTDIDDSDVLGEQFVITRKPFHDFPILSGGNDSDEDQYY